MAGVWFQHCEKGFVDKTTSTVHPNPNPWPALCERCPEKKSGKKIFARKEVLPYYNAYVFLVKSVLWRTGSGNGT